MSESHFPNADDLVRFVDRDLSPEQLERVEDHLRHCAACTAEVAALRRLVEDVSAPPSAPPLDVAAHVAGVMSRLDEATSTEGRSRTGVFVAALLAAAIVALLVVALRGGEASGPHGELAARGAARERVLSREVGVELYAQETSLRSLSGGARLVARTPLTAGVRNLGNAPVFLLLFAIDANDEVHWIAPAYVTSGTDPESTAVPPSSAERLLPTAAAFDDLAPGRLRVVAVVSREPRRVSEVEGLGAIDRSAEKLARRFPRALVREFSLEVTP